MPQVSFLPLPSMQSVSQSHHGLGMCSFGSSEAREKLHLFPVQRSHMLSGSALLFVASLYKLWDQSDIVGAYLCPVVLRSLFVRVF